MLSDEDIDDQNLIQHLRDRIKYLESLIYSPIVKDFLEGVEREVAHQKMRWDDSQKLASDWVALITYLMGKAVKAYWLDYNKDKLKHHVISIAAVCANWHAQLSK